MLSMCKLINLLLFSAVLTGVKVYTEDIEVREGNDLSISCNATASTYVEVYWTLNDTSKQFLQEGPELNFTAINRTNAGEYICNTFDNETKIQTQIETFDVHVLYSAEVNFLNITPAAQMEENDTYIVTCETQGYPPPVWIIMNKKTNDMLAFNLSGSSGIHTTPVKTASCSDTGMIICMASNSPGHKFSSTLHRDLDVYCSPRPGQYDTHDVFSSILGSSALLSMHSAGYPFPNFTWSRDNGKPMGDAEQLDTDQISVLNISNVQIKDFGNYSLTMRNPFGTFVAHYRLSAQGAPDMPYDLSYSNVTSDSVRLYWTSGFDMGSTQEFVVMQRHGTSYIAASDPIVDTSSNHGIGQNWTFVQKHLDSDSDIELTVVARNQLGYFSKFQKPGVMIHTLSIPPKKNSNTALIVGASLGSGVVLAAIVVLIIVLRRMQTKRVIM